MPGLCIRLLVICFVVYCCLLSQHIILIMLSNSIYGIPCNAGPLPGTTKNLHLIHLLLCLILTKHLLSCSKFDWLYVLSMIDLYIVAFNSAIVDLRNSMLKTWNGIKFPSLPMSILYTIFALFWLILDSSLVNITDFINRHIPARIAQLVEQWNVMQQVPRSIPTPNSTWLGVD